MCGRAACDYAGDFCSLKEDCSMHKSNMCNRRPRRADVSVRGSHMSTREVAGNREILVIAAALLPWGISFEGHHRQRWMPVVLAAIVKGQPKDIQDSARHGISVSSREFPFHHAAMPSWQMCVRLVSSQVLCCLAMFLEATCGGCVSL